jgi:hypothetical protein
MAITLRLRGVQGTAGKSTEFFDKLFPNSLVATSPAIRSAVKGD